MVEGAVWLRGIQILEGGEAETAPAQIADDRSQGCAIPRGAPYVKEVHSGGGGQTETTGNDVPDAEALPAQRIHRPAGVARVADRRGLRRHARVADAVSVGQPI